MGAHQVQDEQVHGVDIASLAGELRGELAALDTSAVQVTVGCPTPIILIAEASSLTRNVDPAEYDPHHVSIGPYHRLRNPDLARDKEKLSCLHAVLSVASDDGMVLEVYLEEMARLEDQARSCYAHSFQQLRSAEFVRMLLLDGCYLLVLFGALCSGCGTDPALPVPVAGCDNMVEAVAVVRDVFYLAENQIPFFVIERMYQLTFPDSKVSAVDVFAGYARQLLEAQEYSLAAEPGFAEAPGNLLHILHRYLRPTSSVPSSPTGCMIKDHKLGRLCTATEYHLAGIKIRSRSLGKDGPARCVLDVKLDRGSGVLEVPRLNIDSQTPRLLRNLMALEQCNPEATGSYVTAYCVFLSQLACTERDVELLARSGVIVHGFGNHREVAAMFSDLCKGIVFSVNDPNLNYLAATWEALEGFCCRPRGRRGGHRANSLRRAAGRALCLYLTHGGGKEPSARPDTLLSS